ncbi:glycoside hydrolase family protein [Trinickia sp. NRRL B-1857]|uniref:glycoside hydrolase family protein n=1 Tax=Trinickia sp. NRRL B-1857 TaxID=3162879 RepID=UPI003D26ACF6
MNLTLLEAELRRDENVRYLPYLDTAEPPRRTIGAGHNMDAAPLPTEWTFPLTDAQVNQLLAQDIAKACAGLDHFLPWWRSLDDVRSRVLANMAFNMGIGKLLTFRNTLTDMKLGFYAAAANGMRSSLWARQVGARAQRLARAMETGVMPDEPIAD